MGLSGRLRNAKDSAKLRNILERVMQRMTRDATFKLPPCNVMARTVNVFDRLWFQSEVDINSILSSDAVVLKWPGVMTIVHESMTISETGQGPSICNVYM